MFMKIKVIVNNLAIIVELSRKESLCVCLENQ